VLGVTPRVSVRGGIAVRCRLGVAKCGGADCTPGEECARSHRGIGIPV